MTEFEAQLAYIAALEERVTHSATMKALSPLEHTHLEDYRAHLTPLLAELADTETKLLV